MFTQLATELGQRLKKKKWKLVTAESCTGGGLAYAITQISGSSNWFERGFVTYSNASKQELLGVKNTTLQSFGAVSEQTAREMAEGALQHSEAQLALAITGIAGPDGGSAAKPVGSVWLAWTGINIETAAVCKIFSGNRADVREQSIQLALEILIDHIR